MKKRRYHATDVNQVNWTQLTEQAQEERMVVAIDAAKEKFVAALMRPDRSVLKTIRWSHPQQTRQMVDALLSHWEARTLEVAMEPTGTYGDPLRGLFAAHGVAVYRVSPKRVHDSAEVFDGVPSLHDAKAAYQIGRLHLDGLSRPWEERDEQRRTLATQIALLELYQERLGSSANRLEAQLSRYWPELTQWLDLRSVTLMRLVGEYGSAAEVAAHASQARELMRRSGGGALAARKIEAVLQSAGQTLGASCIEAERVLLQTLAQDMLTNYRASQGIEKALEAEVAADVTVQQMATVVGSTSAAVLQCVLGSPLAYPDTGSYLKSQGLNLKERSSGQFQGQLKITKRGPSLARRYLYFAALRWSHWDPVVHTWYERKVARDGGQRKGKAIVALMRKLAKALWHVARGATFDSRKLFNLQALADAT